MGAPKNRGYKRSWKNYLLNARYQLRFTLTMVGLCAVLMAGLGWWVLEHVKESNEISKDNVRGAECQRPEPITTALVVPELPERATPTVTIDAADATQPPTRPDPEPPAPRTDDIADDPAPEEEGRPARRPVVTITEPDLEVDTFVSVGATVRYQLCLRLQASALERIDDGRRQMLRVIVGASVLILIGLGMWGIKMTHKVAGPLHKVTLYFDKMTAGKFDTVYNLRKGDQLVSFYEHFKRAHAGMKTVDVADTEFLRELIAAADAADVASESADIAAALDELRAIVKRKEEANA